MQVYFNKTWGWVCDEQWNTPDADVVCRQLGYRSSSTALSAAADNHGQETGAAWMNNVQCGGNESSLLSCEHDGWILNRTCGNNQRAGLICSGTPGKILIGHFQVDFCLFLKTSLGAKPFIWKLVSLACSFSCKSNSFSFEWFRTWTRFETEAKGNSEMAYCPCMWFSAWWYFCLNQTPWKHVTRYHISTGNTIFRCYLRLLTFFTFHKPSRYSFARLGSFINQIVIVSKCFARQYVHLLLTQTKPLWFAVWWRFAFLVELNQLPLLALEMIPTYSLWYEILKIKRPYIWCFLCLFFFKQLGWLMSVENPVCLREVLLKFCLVRSGEPCVLTHRI